MSVSVILNRICEWHNSLWRICFPLDDCNYGTINKKLSPNQYDCY